MAEHTEHALSAASESAPSEGTGACTTIWLVRHGETEWNVDTRIQGQLDIALNDVGRWQAQCVGRALAGEAVAAVYASDLCRAVETAKAIVTAQSKQPEGNADNDKGADERDDEVQRKELQDEEQKQQQQQQQEKEQQQQQQQGEEQKQQQQQEQEQQKQDQEQQQQQHHHHHPHHHHHHHQHDHARNYHHPHHHHHPRHQHQHQPTLTLTLTPALRERHLGTLQGKTHKEIAASHPSEFARWRARDAHWEPAGGGESLHQVRERVKRFVEDVAARHVGEQIVLVAHGGVLDSLYRVAASLPVDAPRTWQLGNAAINRLVWEPALGVDGSRLSIVSWGDTSHFKEDKDDKEDKESEDKEVPKVQATPGQQTIKAPRDETIT